MFSLTSRCFCSCLPCLPYSERARVRCLGLHSRNPAVEHFQERQWIQPPWNIALEIKFGLTIYNIHINIYSILYMAQFFLGKKHPPDIPHHLIPLAVQCCLTPELFIYYWKSNVSLICCNILRCFLTRISALGWWSLRGRYGQVLNNIFKPWKFSLSTFLHDWLHNICNWLIISIFRKIQESRVKRIFCACSNWSSTHARTCVPQNMKRGGT